MSLTPEDQKLLRRPYTAEAVKFRIDGKPTGSRVRILTYIDSRLAAERLSDVDPGWSGVPVFVGHTDSDPIGLKVGTPVVFTLTVKGNTRADVGQIGKAQFGPNKGEFEADDKHAKMAVSDALKRAAVSFGVGAYLYTLGNTYADVAKHTVKGEGKYLNDAGKTFLKKQYSDFISKPAFVERFGLPISYGDELKESVTNVVADDTTPVTEPASMVVVVDTPTPAPIIVTQPKAEGTDPYATVIEGIFKLLDRSPEAGVLWLSGRKNKKLAVKKTLKQAAEKGANTDSLDALLESAGLADLVGLY